MAVTFLEKLPILEGKIARDFIDKASKHASQTGKISASEKKIIEEIKKYSKID